MAREALDGTLNIRADKQSLDQFETNASKLAKTTPELIRELIEAFNDNRLNITPTKEQLGLYTS